MATKVSAARASRDAILEISSRSEPGRDDGRIRTGRLGSSAPDRPSHWVGWQRRYRPRAPRATRYWKYRRDRNQEEMTAGSEQDALDHPLRIVRAIGSDGNEGIGRARLARRDIGNIVEIGTRKR